MFVVDVIEALVPRLDAPFLKLNDRLAEAAPEAALAVATHAALLALILHVRLVLVTGEIVHFVQMDHEELAAVAETAAWFGGGGGFDGLQAFAPGRGGGIGAVRHLGFGAFPGFDLVVHRVLVALPVIFTAEAARAVGVGTAVGAGMAFEVFAVYVSVSH